MTPLCRHDRSGLPSFRYVSTDQRNPDFDGAAFRRSWFRFVGSVHRHYLTRELVLFYSDRGPHPDKREGLRAMLESDPRNIGSVLAVCDEIKDRWDGEVAESWRRRAVMEAAP